MGYILENVIERKPIEASYYPDYQGGIEYRKMNLTKKQWATYIGIFILRNLGSFLKLALMICLIPLFMLGADVMKGNIDVELTMNEISGMLIILLGIMIYLFFVKR